MQQAEALRALDELEAMVLHDPQATTTYGELAAALARDPARNSRFVGQLTSRIDLACFYARLPFVSLVKVLTATGKINAESFGRMWAPAREELVAIAGRHAWTSQDFVRLRRCLNGLTDEAVDAQWRLLEQRHGDHAVAHALSYA